MDSGLEDTAREVLRQLEELQQAELSIVALGEPITSASQTKADSQKPQQMRASDASNASLDAPTPTGLEVDLAHYKELFVKLRFSYVEQVTKEKFIRSIVGDPPLIVSPQENLDLENENAVTKEELSALKREVEGMVTTLESMGRQLSRRYENVRLQTVKLRDLPGQAAGLEGRISELELQICAPENDPLLSLPLEPTLDLVGQNKRLGHDLDRELEQLQARVPRKEKEVARLQAELHPLEAKRQHNTTAAADAKRRKDMALGGASDDLEDRGRWWRANAVVLEHTVQNMG